MQLKDYSISSTYMQVQPMVALAPGRTPVVVAVCPAAVAPGQRSAFVTLRRQQMVASTAQGTMCDSWSATTSHVHVSKNFIATTNPYKTRVFFMVIGSGCIVFNLILFFIERIQL